MAVEFQKFPSIPRLQRGMVISEKIDGSNGCIIITDEGEFFVQSRNRILTPGSDNFGFAAWAHAHEAELTETLGIGRHYGEWFGSGIQRGYGFPQGVRKFALFNTKRWTKASEFFTLPELTVVPVIHEGEFLTSAIEGVMHDLKENGSKLVPGFLNPEGVVIYHVAAGATFKRTFDACDQYGHGGKTWAE
jgi:hypothetical protein